MNGFYLFVWQQAFLETLGVLFEQVPAVFLTSVQEHDPWDSNGLRLTKSTLNSVEVRFLVINKQNQGLKRESNVHPWFSHRFPIISLVQGN